LFVLDGYWTLGARSAGRRIAAAVAFNAFICDKHCVFSQGARGNNGSGNYLQDPQNSLQPKKA
jgi:hypothetical protein